MIYQKVLKNGLKMVIAPMSGTQTVTSLVMVKTGSKYESEKQSGLSHFLEHLFFKGTKKRPTALALSSELDSIGGEYNAFTSKEFTGYFIKASKNKLTASLELLSDMLLNSKFESEEIDRERGVIIEELNMYEDNPRLHLEDVFENCLYGDTPAGRDTIGTKENIKNFKRDDFIKYLASQYGRTSTTIIVAGNVNYKVALKEADKYFSAYPASKYQKKVAVKDSQIKPNIKIKVKKTDQLHLSLGVRTFAAGDPEEISAKLLSVVLGGSMSSRLFSKLRERHGLAYYVRTQAEFYTDSGYLTTSAGVPNDKLEQAIDIILNEYRLVSKELVSPAELKRAKDLIVGRFNLQLEGSDNLANWYGQQFILRSKYSTPEEFLRKIKAVTARDLQKVAKRIFVSRHLNLAIIGQVNNLAKIQRSLKI